MIFCFRFLVVAVFVFCFVVVVIVVGGGGGGACVCFFFFGGGGWEGGEARGGGGGGGSVSLSFAGNSGRLTLVRHSSRRSSAAHSYQCVQFLRASKQWNEIFSARTDVTACDCTWGLRLSCF